MHPLSEIIEKRAGQNARYLVAIAGAPGSGKSTVAQTVADDIGAVVVPMDGFHLDNAVLDDRGWRARKGAPHTFDVGGFVSLVDRLRHPDAEVFVPVFDRDADLARTAARCVGAEARIILIAHYDQSAMKNIERAIRDSDLGVNRTRIEGWLSQL